ncbi:MAG: Smr/MutS family protein [Thermoanaerobaculaceae bacterium]|jgi:dsDNA-specific endonuclease/ATPase MutS2
MDGPDELTELPIEDSLDLHTFAPRDVANVVDEYLRAARAAGFHEVRLIHGRGRGVQRAAVHAVIARLPWVVSAHEAPPDRGGWGATVVTLGALGEENTVTPD